MSKLLSDVDATIVAAAERIPGVSQATVCPYVERPNRFQHRDTPETWFLLSVRRQPGADWELIGRRKTKAELFELAKAMSTAQEPEIQVLGLS